jgi:uncharacterized membrane protein YesL
MGNKNSRLITPFFIAFFSIFLFTYFSTFIKFFCPTSHKYFFSCSYTIHSFSYPIKLIDLIVGTFLSLPLLLLYPLLPFLLHSGTISPLYCLMNRTWFLKKWERHIDCVFLGQEAKA